MAGNNKIAVILTAIDKMSGVVDSAVNKSQAKLNQLSDNAMKMGRSLAASGLAVGAPLYGAIKEAMDFEKRMVDIRKQMAEDTPESVRRMTGEVLALSKELPLATAEIQDMIAAGLRMGIAQDKVIDYTREVTKMAVAFDMPADLIADSMGKIANVFKIPIARVGEFADAINWLDDNTMAKGPELIDVLQRIGGAAKYLDPKEAAALASTMLSLGESAETSGSGISTMINILGAAEMGSAKFRKGLTMLGIQAADLQKRMSDKSTARSAIIDVFDRINKLDVSKQTEALVRLFGQEHGPKLQKLTNNMAEFRRQLGLVQGQEKGSMNREYAKRIETATSKWQLFRNKLRGVAMESGSTLIPSFNKAIEALGRIMDRVSGFINRNPQLTANIGMIAAAFAGVSLAGAGLSFAIGGVAKAMNIVIGVFSGVVKAVRFLTTTWKALQLMISFGGGPIILAVMAIAGVAFLLIKYWKPIKSFFSDVWDGVKAAVNIGVAAAKAIFLNFTPVGLIYKHWDAIVGFFKGIVDKIKEFASSFFESGKQIIDSIINGITSRITAITDKVKEVTQRIRDHFPFSPAKAGALKDIHKIKIIETVAEGIKPAALVNKIRSVAGVAIKPIKAMAAVAVQPFTVKKGFILSQCLMISPTGVKFKNRFLPKFTKALNFSLMPSHSSTKEKRELIRSAIELHRYNGTPWAVKQALREKRELIRAAIELHRYNGTPWAVKQALQKMGFTGVKIKALMGFQHFISKKATPSLHLHQIKSYSMPAKKLQPIKPVSNTYGQQPMRGKGGATIQPVFNITVNGVQNKSQVIKVTDEMKRQFDRWMKEYESQKMRVSF